MNQANWNEQSSTIKNVGIVGAGISGLISAAIMKKEGYSVKIFERSENIGGVWELGYSNQKLQSPSNLYQIPFFKPSIEWPEYPTAQEIRNYILEFVESNSIGDCINLSHDVLSITNIENGHKRKITFKFNQEVLSEDFDFVIISTGVFSDPRIPEIPGKEKFKGVVTHSSKFYDSEAAKGKKVVVVGLGKSSLDCLSSTVDKAEKLTFLYRSLYWPIPESLQVFGKNLRPDEFLSNRFIISLKNGFEINNADPLERFAHKSAFGKWLTEKLFAEYEKKVDEYYGLSQLGMKPNKKIQDDVYSSFIAPKSVFDHFHTGKINQYQDDISEFYENGIITKEGRKIECDLVIFGTGFSPKMNYISEEEKKILFSYDKEALYLYRGIINPNIPNMAFIGYMPSLCNPLTSALSILWLGKALKGLIPLNKEEMDNHLFINARKNRNFHEKLNMRIKGNLLKDLHLYDSLLKDMGADPYRKRGSFAHEYLTVYTPNDYASLFSDYR